MLLRITVDFVCTRDDDDEDARGKAGGRRAMDVPSFFRANSNDTLEYTIILYLNTITAYTKLVGVSLKRVTSLSIVPELTHSNVVRHVTNAKPCSMFLVHWT